MSEENQKTDTNEWESKDLVSFIALLFEIDKRENPERYKEEKND